MDDDVSEQLIAALNEDAPRLAAALAHDEPVEQLLPIIIKMHNKDLLNVFLETGCVPSAFMRKNPLYYAAKVGNMYAVLRFIEVGELVDDALWAAYNNGDLIALKRLFPYEDPGMRRYIAKKMIKLSDCDVMRSLLTNVIESGT